MTAKEFDLLKAVQGAPLVTQDGRKARLIAYVPKAKFEHRLVVLVGDEVWRRQPDGKHCASCDGRTFPAVVLKGRKGSGAGDR